MNEIPAKAQSCNTGNLTDKIMVSLDVKISKDPIEFILLVKNKISEPVQICFSSTKKFDFIVSQANREVWRFSSGKMYAQVIIEETIIPGKSLRFTHMWDGRLTSGEKLVAGEYQVTALLSTIPELRSNPVIFRMP